MEKGLKGIPMVIRTLDSSNMVRRMEKEFIHGKMEKSMMVNGIKASNKVMVFGKEQGMIHILENGAPLKLMGMVFTLGLMEIDMKDNGICA